MYFEVINRLIKRTILTFSPIRLPVIGDSMEPAIFRGDIATIEKNDKYYPGDILAFSYKNNNILIHRLLKTDKFKYYCKGDNSFRLEDIQSEQIYGKVIQLIRNGKIFSPHEMSKNIIEKSYQVGIEFKRLNYDYEKIIKSDIYVQYAKEYLHVNNAMNNL